MSANRQVEKRSRPERTDRDRLEPTAKLTRTKSTKGEEDDVQVLSATRGVQPTSQPAAVNNTPATFGGKGQRQSQSARPTPFKQRAQVPAKARTHPSAGPSSFQGSRGGGVNVRRSGLTIPLAPSVPVELPFCETIQELCPLTPIGDGSAYVLRLYLPVKVASRLCLDEDVVVKLRLFRAGQLLLDEVPDDCVVKVNDRVLSNVGMPERVPSHRPNQPVQRKSRPIDLTRALKELPGIYGGGTVRIEIKWRAVRGERWSAGVWVARKLSVEAIYQKLLANKEKRLPRGEMLKRLRAYSNSGDDTLTMLSKPTVSLNCPMTLVRIETPVRGVKCAHLDCFDLRSFLNMNERDPKWKCPSCNSEARYSDLRVDEYLGDVLAHADDSVARVELSPDGTWRDVEGRSKQRQTSVENTSSERAPVESRGEQHAKAIELRPAVLSEPVPVEVYSEVRAQPAPEDQRHVIPEQVLESFNRVFIYEDMTMVLVHASCRNPPNAQDAGDDVD